MKKILKTIFYYITGIEQCYDFVEVGMVLPSLGRP